MLPMINSFDEYEKIYKKSIENPESFWADIADHFEWHQKWDQVCSADFQNANFKWFEGGQLNITENCLDRHLEERGDKKAIIWEPNDPDEPNREFTYEELHQEVCRFANVLLNNGVEKGDRVCIYMPMVPELAFAVLACARIGAIHSVVFGGFSAQALAQRIDDADCKILLTTDSVMRGKKEVRLKDISDEAMQKSGNIEKCIVLKRTGNDIHMEEGRDSWWHDELEEVSSENEAEVMNAEDPLFILYTSGSTGKPKGVVHTIGGYMVGTAYTFKNVFQYEEEDIYWCTADIGWITGHSYIVYGPLLCGATTVMYEGTPTYPDPGRLWDIVDKYKVNQFYTAPTAIRALQAKSLDFIKDKDLSSLKVLGTVGEPINEEAWQWYHKHIGKGRCPIVDTWWQTETGGIMISPIAGVTPLKPTYATLPLPGVKPVLVDDEGEILEGNDVKGSLCIEKSWPFQARTIYGNHERFIKTYYSDYPGKYFTGDACYRDEDGYYRITGRIDDVLNVSGHRIGTAEVENAIDECENVTETAVVGFPHDIKGQGIYAFVKSFEAPDDEAAFKEQIVAKVREIIGPIAKPDKIQFVDDLPKTRSGKIMRRILRKIAKGEEDFGDTTTLLNPEVVEAIKEQAN